jgi:predicted HicB family RNase H-like nuclease
VGRPSKGLRHRVSARIPATLHVIVAREAERRGLTVNDWVLWAIRNGVDASMRQKGPNRAAP